MPALFIYLIKVNVALLIFCLGYYAVLRHLTFYNLNRIYLVTAILFSSLYPRLDVSDFLNRHETIAKPIQVVIVDWQEPVKNANSIFLGHDIWFWLQAAFWVGVILFTVRLGIQLLSLYRLHQRSEPVQLRHYMIRIVKGDINPFSFWRSIYINPDNHPAGELDAILEHEQIHVNELHTMDILLAEVSAIFYWFNPGIWLMKRAIRENIEFITDRKILQKGVDSKAYQYSLLNVNFGAQNNAIVNHFNISTIKKRIIMMNAKRSSTVNITRYLFLIPAVMVLLLVFSVSKAAVKKTVSKSTTTVMNVIKLAVKQMDLTGDEKLPAAKPAVTAALRKKQPELMAFGTTVIQNDTLIRNGKIIATDTGKRITIKLRGANAVAGPQPTYFIDGVKMEKGLEGVDPDRIQSINVIKDASTMPNGAVYIFTKGVNDTSVSAKLVNRIYMDTKPGDKKDLKEVTVIGYGTAKKLTGKVQGLSINAPNTIKKIVIDGDTVYSSNVQHVITGHPTLINGVKDTNDALFIHNIQRRVNGIPLKLSAAGTPALKLEQIGDKLIVLNGKAITQAEFKKLSPDTIATVNIIDGETGTALYGDKGKKGAVIITTKKKL